MASITLTGRTRAGVGSVTVEVDSLNWQSFYVGQEIEKDALPSDLISILVSTDKGSWIYYPPVPQEAPWWKRVLGMAQS